MATFICESCHCVENSSYGQFLSRNRPNLVHEEDLGKMLCSACRKSTFPDGSLNKFGGKWHNRFKRQYLDPTKFENRLVDGLWKIVEIETGEVNWGDALSDEPFK